MTQYAYFDHAAPSPSPVLGWYDTAEFEYASFPAEADLIALTDEQWAARLDGSAWAVEGAALVALEAVAPALTQEQEAAIELARRIGLGIAITCTRNPAINATYALDSVSTAQVFQLGLFASQFDTFPGGATQFYPDITGAPHEFTVAEFVAFLRAVAPLVSALTTQASVMAHGGPPSWPTQTATIP